MQDAPRPDERHVWSKWFWSDWRSDAGIELCSWAARGLWMECLALMAKSEQRGYLLVAGKFPNDRTLLKLTRGASMTELRRCLEELTHRQVCSWTPAGVMFSRRMVRDAAASARNSANGRHGGNPALTQHRITEPAQSRLTESDNQVPQALEARSQKPDAEDQTRPRKKRVDYPPDFEAFWVRYPNKSEKLEALKAWKKLAPDAQTIAAIHTALDWQLRQPKWVKDNGEYVVYAERWLERRRFEDEPFHAPDEPKRTNLPNAAESRSLLKDAGFPE